MIVIKSILMLPAYVFIGLIGFVTIPIWLLVNGMFKIFKRDNNQKGGDDA